MKHWYITGTDTEIGKTRVSCQLLQELRRQGFSTVAYKPVASGAVDTGDGWRNDDALQLIHASQAKIAYNVVNPWCFEEAVAPHLLAEEAGVDIDTAKMAEIVSRKPADVAVIEGVGGWLAPLDTGTSQADMARALNAGVILVVGMRLGCINHALLSVGRILDDGLPLLGWVANQIDPEMSRYQDNIDTLKARIKQPLLATIAWEENQPDFSINAIIN
ncbi:MAG: dethiobiotin synthase [Xanthomonadales bacterium]|nr:dethiobiotin synthase [Xanthomonadales bacterium]